MAMPLRPTRPSSAMLSDFTNSEYDESTSLMRQVRSEAHTPDSPHSTGADHEDANDDATSSGNGGGAFNESRRSRSRFTANGNANGIGGNGHHGNGNGNGKGEVDYVSKRNSVGYRSLERLSRGPGRVSVWSEEAQIQVPHPFRGAQSSQMICSGCSYKVNLILALCPFINLLLTYSICPAPSPSSVTTSSTASRWRCPQCRRCTRSASVSC